MLAGSIEFVRVPLRAPQGVIEELSAEIAVLPEGVTIEAAVWQDATIADNVARTLIGPLPAGNYRVLVRIQDNPETPILSAGRLAVTN